MKSHVPFSYYTLIRLKLDARQLSKAEKYLANVQPQMDERPRKKCPNECFFLDLERIHLKLLRYQDLDKTASQSKTLIRNDSFRATNPSTRTYLKHLVLRLTTQFHPKHFAFEYDGKSIFEKFLLPHVFQKTVYSNQKHCL